MWLSAIVVVSAVARIAFGGRMAAPWIMVDELIYSELAKSFAAGGQFLLREEPSAYYGVVYPVLIAPAWALFNSIPDAYAAAKAINAVLMSLAAVPAYFLARRLLGPLPSLLAAALTVLVPSMVYTGTLMTENAFYPLFLCIVLALVLTLERPTLGRQLLLLALCGVGFLTRTQALAFVPAALTAPLLLAWIERRPWRELRPYRLLYGVVVGGGLLVLLVQLVRGHSPADVLGAYAVAGEHRYQLDSIARWLLYHVAELDLYLGIIPFAAFLLLVATARGLPRPVQTFVAASVAVAAWFLLEVSAFASLPSVQRIEERNLFYLAPLALIALLAWIVAGQPRPPRATALAAAAAAALPGAIPYAHLIGVPSQSDTLALLPLWRLQDTVVSLDDLSAVVVCCSLVAAALLFLPRRYAFLLPALVAGYFLVAQNSIEKRLTYASEGARAEGIGARHVDWVDRAVAGRGEVVMLWTGNTSRFSIWENEFFSRAPGRLFYLVEPMGGGLPQTKVTVDRQTGLLRDPQGRTISAPYALSDGSVTPAGSVAAADERRGIFLYRLAGPLRSTTHVTGLYANDTWSGPRVVYRRMACRGGSLTVLLGSDVHLFPTPSLVVARSGNNVRSRRVPSEGRAYPLTVPLTPQAGVCTVRFTVSPTKVPGHGDLRRLGLHFSAFRYRPPGP
jgi:4-amino-4-deoxy-L-arabinose transferase-like glycosyltransferase